MHNTAGSNEWKRRIGRLPTVFNFTQIKIKNLKKNKRHKKVSFTNQMQADKSFHVFRFFFCERHASVVELIDAANKFNQTESVSSNNNGCEPPIIQQKNSI